MPKLTPPITPRLPDIDAERARREISDKVTGLQKLPMAGFVSIKDKTLADSATTLIPHTLGRIPTMVWVSPPRGASATGRIEEIRDGSYDRSKFVALRATGWGATVTVDVAVL